MIVEAGSIGSYETLETTAEQLDPVVIDQQTRPKTASKFPWGWVVFGSVAALTIAFYANKKASKPAKLAKPRNGKKKLKTITA